MRKLEVDVQMSGVPSEITDHPTNGLEADSLFGADRKLNVIDSSIFASSPPMKPTTKATSMSFSMMNRPFDDFHQETEDSAKLDTRCPEHVDLDELDAMLDDL